LAVSNNALVDGHYIGRQVAVVRGLSGMATAALQQRLARALFRFGQIGEIDAPKIHAPIGECHAVNVCVFIGADLSHDPALDLFARLFVADDEFLLGRQLVRGDNSSTVAAEHDGLGALGEDPAFQVASNESDSDLLGNASTATCAV
jgi:hypothetical protein